MSYITTAIARDAAALLEASGRKATMLRRGDAVAEWSATVWRAVRDPRIEVPPPPAEVRHLVESAEAESEVVALALSLTLAAWECLSEGLSSVARDPEGDGTAAEHDALGLQLVAGWEASPDFERLESHLAELLPRVAGALAAVDGVMAEMGG